MNYKTPGVKVEEISKLPPSIAQVETAIPAFIGYTENTSYNGLDLIKKPTRIRSMKEYEEIFGFGKKASFTINVAKVGDAHELAGDIADPGLSHRMYYCMQLFFGNGGGPCYIVSVGADTVSPSDTVLKAGLDALKKEDEPTIIVFPDAPALGKTQFYQLYKDALQQCKDLGDRVAIVDVFEGYKDFNEPANSSLIDNDFRNGVGNNNLKYGAVYYPWLRTNLNYLFDETTQTVTGGDVSGFKLKDDADEANSVYHADNDLYHKVIKAINKIQLQLPPSSAMAGVYAYVDSTRGVWKAPANVSLSKVKEPLVNLSDEDQQSLNVHTSGKSVNAIRKFAGKGIIVWGARTLAGNDNEWRYISVRRFYNMVEESVKKATFKFVFEPNDANTWSKVRSMIENFLVIQWRQGALQGAKPDEAFFVNVGLGETMTAQDILEGRMIVEIGMAVVRPAEFIILRFSHFMQEG